MTARVMTWQEVMTTASEEVVGKALAIVEAVDAGKLTSDQGVRQLVVLLSISRDQAVQLADVYTAGQLGSVPTGWSLGEDGLEAEHAEEARAAFEADDPRPGITVMASAAVLDALQAGRHHALKSQGVEYWVREAEPDACEVCLDLASKGAAPMSLTPWHHKGCACSQEPLTTTEGENA